MTLVRGTNRCLVHDENRLQVAGCNYRRRCETVTATAKGNA